MDYLAERVGDLVDLYVPASEAGVENVLDHLDVVQGQDGMVVVAGTEHVRWSEFEVPAWRDTNGRHIVAAEKVFREFYGVDDTSYTEDDDEGHFRLEWAVEVAPTCTLADALDMILRREPEGPVGFHNCMNGAYGARRNAYRDVKEAVAAVPESVGV